jgi:peptide chain release factor 1
MNMLRARIKEKIDRDRAEKKDKKRRKHIGSGDRSQKIRTYNFPQNRITDHRVNLKVYNLEGIVGGSLLDFIVELRKKLREQELSEL